MGNRQTQEAAWDMLYLVSCILNDVQPDRDKVTAMDLEQLYHMAAFQNMEAMVCMALEKAGAFQSADRLLVGKWKEAEGKAIRKNMLLDREREQIIRKMEEAGIWYMPLKGSLLQGLYPRYGMRQMADNDILYDASRRKDIFALMEQQGFTVAFSSDKDDEFVKLPVCAFEMHTLLFKEKGSPELYEYYRMVEERLVTEDSHPYARHFTDEDFYIYMVAHAYRHYEIGGGGFRALTDCYVYIRSKGSSMDWDYIREEFEKLGIAEFAEQLRELSTNLFHSPDGVSSENLTEQNLAMLEYFARTGTYGTAETNVGRRIKEMGIEDAALTTKGKLRYLRKRLFPDMEWFRKNAPFFAEHKVWIPFFLVYRMFRHIFCYRKWLRTELRVLWGTGKEKQEEQ